MSLSRRLWTTAKKMECGRRSNTIGRVVEGRGQAVGWSPVLVDGDKLGDEEMQLGFILLMPLEEENTEEYGLRRLELRDLKIDPQVGESLTIFITTRHEK